MDSEGTALGDYATISSAYGGHRLPIGTIVRVTRHQNQTSLVNIQANNVAQSLVAPTRLTALNTGDAASRYAAQTNRTTDAPSTVVNVNIGGVGVPQSHLTAIQVSNLKGVLRSFGITVA